VEKLFISDYEYTFCLGIATGGYQAGIAKLSSAGIKDAIPCTDTAENCKLTVSDDSSGTRKQIDDFLSKVDFGAQFEVESDYSDYGKILAIDEPKEYYDLLQLLNSARSESRDAKRLADVRQMASALSFTLTTKAPIRKIQKT